jgi:threonine dehydrogenase-like Zn-dependent dehydrogenase
MGCNNPQKYIPSLNDHILERRIDPSILITHTMLLDDGPQACAMFKHERNECLKVVFTPNRC